MFKKVAGTKDILPQEVCYWQRLEEISRLTFDVYNYKEIRPPIIEEAALFNRSLGKDTEIVQKQMFLIKRDDDLYVLRPEATAAIVRAYLENNYDKTSPFIKFYYLGPMFRAERPQKGRLRQFHHIGCEALGSADPDLDVEIISLAKALLEAYGIAGYRIQINSLGCITDKKRLTQELQKKLKDKLDKLCLECQARFKHNILRVLDCKNAVCQEVVKKNVLPETHLCPDCQNHFEKVKAGLGALKIPYEISSTLVRGLDYYTRTVFEITHKDLGAQNALGAGGRYDNLIKDLGGPELGAIGFAFGVERLLLVAGRRSGVTSKNLVYIITLDENAKDEGIKLLNNLRHHGIASDTDYSGRSLKGALREANDLGAKYVVIIGENELKNNSFTLKSMSSGEQKEIKQEELLKILASGNGYGNEARIV